MSNPNSAPTTTPEAPKQDNNTKKIKDLQEQVDFLTERLAQVESAKPQAPAGEPRQAIFAELHEQIFLPSLGQLPKSMDCSPNSQQPKLRGLKMTATNFGLEVELRGRTGFIPWGNISWCVFKTLSANEAKEADKHAGPNTVAPGYHGPTKVGTATVTAK